MYTQQINNQQILLMEVRKCAIHSNDDTKAQNNMGNLLIKTQFEIERRSYGQSMTYFRFFSCGGQTNFIGCHSFFVCAL